MLFDTVPMDKSEAKRESDFGVETFYLQSFIISGVCVHLNFQGVYLQCIRAFTGIIGAVFLLARTMKISDFLDELAVFASIQPQTSQFDVGFQPQSLVIRTLKRLESLRIKLLHAVVGFLIVGTLLDEIQHIVDGLFGIIASDRRFHIGEKFLIVFDSLASLISSGS